MDRVTFFFGGWETIARIVVQAHGSLDEVEAIVLEAEVASP